MHYIVQPGDSIYQLARRYHIGAEAILLANNLIGSKYTYPGQLLNIPVPTKPLESGKEYIVQPGETLYDIATQHQISLRELIQINHIQAPYLAYAGQELILPVGNDS